MEIPYSEDIVTEAPVVTLRYLFFKFLKIGMVSFGGYMALVAMIQRELVEKDKVIEQEVITDGVSIASLLPGPLAVNIVAYIGYHTKNKTGAVIAVLGVLLPASIAMLILSWCYFNYGYKAHWNEVLFYTAGAVSGIILTAGVNIYKKEVKGDFFKKRLMCVVAYPDNLDKELPGNLSVDRIRGACRVFFNMDKSAADKTYNPGKSNAVGFLNWKIKAAALLLVAIELSYIFNAAQYFQNIYLKISLIFSGISLSLFGGGYVMIPIMQSLLVGNLKWLSPTEFLDCIAFSQLTPGPILVSSIFVGYKLTGIVGGIVALLAIFGPSAVLMMMVSKLFAVYKNNQWLKNALAGIRPVVVGLIIASAYKLLQSVPLNLLVVIICVVTFFVGFKYRVSPVYMILASLLAGVCLTILHYNV